MDKATIGKLLERYQRKSDDAFRRYQQTGSNHQYWEYKTYGDIADICAIAYQAADDHQSAVTYRAICANLAGSAKRLLNAYGIMPEDVYKLIKEVRYADLS